MKSMKISQSLHKLMAVAGLVLVLLLALTGMAVAAPEAPYHSVAQVALIDRPAAPSAPMGKSTIGDYVWWDTNANGDQDLGEVGIDGVIVNLYQDVNKNGVIDPGVDDVPGITLFTMTTGDDPDTAGTQQGWYAFDVTAAGNQYIVEIDPANFDPGGALENYVLTSTVSYPDAWVVPLPGLIETYLDADFGYGLAALNVVKSSTTTQITAAGQVVPYTFVVTNEGNVTLTDVTVTDAQCDAPGPVYVSGDANNDGELQVDETWTYTCDHTVTQAEIDSQGDGDGDLDNTVTADSNESGPDTDDHFIPILYNPLLAVAKSSTTTQITTAGQVVPYTFVVTNEGNVTLTGVTVTDAQCDAPGPVYVSGDANNDGELQVDETWTYTCDHTVTQAEIDSQGDGDGDLDNTVTADSNESGPDTDDHFIPILYNPLLAVAKSSTTTQITTAGQVVPYTFVVTNEGNVTLTGVTVTDAKCDAPGPVYVSGDDGDGLLEVGEAWTYTCNHTVTQAEIDAGTGVLTNTVTADSNQTPPDTDTETIPVIYIVEIDVEKSVWDGTTWVDADTPPGPTLLTGNNPQFRFVVTNTGKVTLSNITLTDSDFSLAGCAIPLTLAPGVSFTCTITATWASGQHTNTATAAGSFTDANNNTQTDTDTDDANYLGAASSFGDLVWWDVDGDGIQDAGEPGIPGVTIDLFGYPSVTTDANGAYTFTNLPGGSYVPNIDATQFAPGGPLEGFTMSPAFVGGVPNAAIDSNGVTDGAGGVQASVNLPASTSNPTIDFGFVKPTSYTLTKVSMETQAVRVGDPVEFKITIQNTGDTYISVLPLVDTFDPAYLQFVSASVAPDSTAPLGTLTWNDLTGAGMLAPDSFFDVFLNFITLADTTGILPDGETINTATVLKDNTRVDPDGPGGVPEAVPPTTDLTSSDGVMAIQPTGLALASATATATAEGVLVAWETADETAILGFNVLRDGMAVNAEFILAGASGTSTGGAYSFLDAGASGAGVYALEVIKLDGSVEAIAIN